MIDGQQIMNGIIACFIFALLLFAWQKLKKRLRPIFQLCITLVASRYEATVGLLVNDPTKQIQYLLNTMASFQRAILLFLLCLGGVLMRQMVKTNENSGNIPIVLLYLSMGSGMFGLHDMVNVTIRRIILEMVSMRETDTNKNKRK